MITHTTKTTRRLIEQYYVIYPVGRKVLYLVFIAMTSRYDSYSIKEEAFSSVLRCSVACTSFERMSARSSLVVCLRDSEHDYAASCIKLS